jgi:hypothetical protein
MCYSKCAGCDERNATIYDDSNDDMYCVDCYEQKQIDDACYCDSDRGITCHLHWDD